MDQIDKLPRYDGIITRSMKTLYDLPARPLR